MAMSIAVEGAMRGERWLWGAPTYDQVRIGWDETRHGVGDVATFTQQRMTAEFPTGGVVIFRSLDDPNNARGHTADGVVIDEAAFVKEAAWYEVLRPMLLDTGGPLWAIGTPNGRNWFWREHIAAIDRDDSAMWQVPTLGCEIVDGGLKRKPHPLENPNIAFGEIEQLWLTLSERAFRQEILAEFIEDAAGVFRGVRDAAKSEPETKHLGADYVFGVDWGKHSDFTVVTVIRTDQKRIVAMDRFNQIDYVLQAGRLKALYEHYLPGLIVAERNAMGEPLIEQLQRDGLPVEAFVTTNASKAQAIDALSLAFERKEITILNDPVLIAELQAFEMQRLPSGMFRYSAPEGMHDDCVMSLALAWHGLSKSVVQGVRVY